MVRMVATARLRPTEGLYVRGSTTFEVTDEVTLATAGAGIEVYFGGSGVQWHGQGTSGEALLHTLAFGSDEPGESIIPSVRRVPVLEVKGSIPYQPRGGLFGSREASWLDTLELMRRVEDDAGVIGFVVHLDGAALSMAKARELRDRILALEEADIPVLVYLDRGASNTAYYVASASSRVAMHPAGELRLIGLSAELMTARGLLDLVGVEPQFIKRGTYKSAPETFTHVEPSEAALEQTNALLDDLFDDLVDAVATGRDLDHDEARRRIDGGPYDAQGALDAGLVDVLVYPDQLSKELAEVHGAKPAEVDLASQPQPHSPWEDPQQIAVIYVTGAIVGGESQRPGLLSSGNTGSDTVVRQLDRARKDRNVRAVVLRVDSPGGSVYASDAIWHAAQRVVDADKPLVVSMGTYAASGGYYVSAPADAIWAEPSTITGSIGVYMGTFDPTELLDRVGVEVTRVSRGRNSNLAGGLHGYDEAQREHLQQMTDRIYETFKARVAEGREMEMVDVEAVAQGRVWSGVDALEIGLVDELGGLQDAIADARERAGIPAKRKVGIVSYSRGGSMLESLAPSVAAQMSWPLPTSLRLPSPVQHDDLNTLKDAVAPWTVGLQPLLLHIAADEHTVWAMEPFTRVIEGNGEETHR